MPLGGELLEMLRKMVLGLGLLLLLAGWPGGEISQALQRQEGWILKPQHAILLVARALDQSDMLLLASGGIISGRVQNEEFPLELEDGSIRHLTRSEIDTLDLGFAERPLDRVVLQSGETLQGDLRVENFQIKPPLGGNLLAAPGSFPEELPKAALRGIILRVPQGGRTLGGPVPKAGMVNPIIRRLLVNPLIDILIVSLTRYDWLMLRDGGLLSGSVLDETLPFRSITGQLNPLAREALSLVLFNWPPGQDMAVLRATGVWILGTVELSRLQVRLAPPLGDVELPKAQLFGAFFRVTTLGTGGPGPGG